VTILEAGFLALAGFVSGGINAVAGGGSLISFPALLAVGYPSIAANVTNTVAVWPGGVGGTVAYRPELAGQRDRIVSLGVVSIVGALVGSVLLLASSDKFFSTIVPYLILFATLLLAVQPRLAGYIQNHRRFGNMGERALPLLIAQFLVAIYGAYFGAGQGIMMLAFLGIFLVDDIQRLNALKGLLAALNNGVGVLYFAFFGPVVWQAALLMAVTATLGGFAGVRVARRLSAARLRVVVLVFGVVVAVKLLFL
jgi:uncharacterized membrane protein YfcA